MESKKGKKKKSDKSKKKNYFDRKDRTPEPIHNLAKGLKRAGPDKNLGISSQMTDELEPAGHLVSYDKNLFGRVRTQWQFGDWSALVALDRANLHNHPKRAKLALLAAAGHLQQGNISAARELIEMAHEWGCSKKLTAQILVSGVYNTLGRVAALMGQRPQALQHFEYAISIGVPAGETRLLTQARVGEQYTHLRIPAVTSHAKVGTDDIENISDTQLAAPYLREDVDLTQKYYNFSSAQYWEKRYSTGGTSGYGSYGRLAEFKARVLNKFIADEDIKRVIEFGCGDGNQLSMIKVDEYIGIDISPFVIDKCREKYKDDPSRIFFTNDEFAKTPLCADLTLSLDVIFHLIEDEVFDAYMHMLFNASVCYCIIYACDEDWIGTDAVHVRRRKFTDWIANHMLGWRLMQVTYNKYPYDGSRNPKDLSFSNLYFYEREN